METATLRLTIAPDLQGEPSDADSALTTYAVFVECSSDTPSMVLTLVPSGHPKSSFAPDRKQHIVASFDISDEKHKTFAVAGKTASPRFFANSFSLAVYRILTGMYPNEYDVTIPVKVVVRKDAGRGFELSTSFPISFLDPVGFATDSRITLLDDFEKEDTDMDIRTRVASPSPTYVPHADVSDISGDVRRPSTPGLREFGLAPLTSEKYVRTDADDEQYDAQLMCATDPVAKYMALANTLASMLTAMGLGRKPHVVIIGDHPGTLGNALASLGIDSTGLDPQNRDIVIEHPGGGVRTLRCAEVKLDAPHEFLPDAYDAVVVDTSSDNEHAEVCTARNCNLGMQYKGLVVVQARSSPTLTKFYAYGLLLPGQSVSGCEQYLLLSKEEPGGGGEKWERWAWFLVACGEIGKDYVVKLSPQVDHDLVAMQYRAGEEGTFLIRPDHWYGFVVTRQWLRAKLSTSRPVPRALRSNFSALGILAATSIIREGLLADDRKRLCNLFQPSHIVDTVGIPRDLFNRHPSMPDVVAGRYDALLVECSQAHGQAPEELQKIMGDVKTGVLLQRLSEVRGILAVDIELARYSRVLPYESMAAIAYQPIFRLVKIYLRVLRTVVNKAMHSWELQYLLWALTCFGNEDDKLHYMLVLLEGAAVRPRTARAPMRAGAAGRHALDTLVSKLKALGVYGPYTLLDDKFARALLLDPVQSMPPPKRPPSLVISRGVSSSRGSRSRGSAARM